MTCLISPVVRLLTADRLSISTQLCGMPGSVRPKLANGMPRRASKALFVGHAEQR